MATSIELRSKILSKEFLLVCLIAVVAMVIATYYGTLRHYSNWGIVESEEPYLFGFWLIVTDAIKSPLTYPWAIVAAFISSVFTALLSIPIRSLRDKKKFMTAAGSLAVLLIFISAHVSSNT